MLKRSTQDPLRLFKKSLSSMFFNLNSPPTAKLTVYTWRSEKGEIARVACQLDITLHSHTSKKIVDATKSILVDIAQNESNPITINDHKKILEICERKPINAINIYLSPQSIEDETENSLQNKLFKLQQKEDQKDQHSISLLKRFYKKPFVLRTKTEDFLEYRMHSLEEINLTHLDFEQISSTLAYFSKLKHFISCKYENGILSESKMAQHSNYYLTDTLLNYFTVDEFLQFDSKVYCATIIMQLLRLGFDTEVYINLLTQAQKDLGHKNICPELVLKIAELAKSTEMLTTSKRPQP